MESRCWGREAKSCLSEFSGCRSLLKCQVLLKNNTPLSPHTHHHPHLLPLSQPYCLPSRTKPRSSQWWHTGWGMNPRLGSTSGQTPAFLLPSEVLIHLVIYLFHPPPPPPHLPRGGNSEGDEMKSFLFPCFHFPATVTVLLLILSISSAVSSDFSHDVAPDLIGPKISQAPSNPSVQ